MRRDAGIARAENCVNAVNAPYGRTAAARLALIAWRGSVIEIGATRALQEIAAGRCHVAQLLRRASHDSVSQERITLLDHRMPSEVGIRHQRANAHAAIGCF